MLLLVRSSIWRGPSSSACSCTLGTASLADTRRSRTRTTHANTRHRRTIELYRRAFLSDVGTFAATSAVESFSDDVDEVIVRLRSPAHSRSQPLTRP